MTSITAQTTATLDGVIDAPDVDALLPYMSDAGRQGALDLALAADALLLPRETWQSLARAWRDQTGPMAERLNAMPKYVVSATLRSADEWDHTTIVGYGDIAGLREREQLLTYGCGRLARDLLIDGLLDVLVLSLTPVVAGFAAFRDHLSFSIDQPLPKPLVEKLIATRLTDAEQRQR